jgi:hypothetical protein
MVTNVKVKTLKSGAQVKVGSAFDPDSPSNRIKKQLKRARSPELRDAVVKSQKDSLERGGVQRQANKKTGDPGELSVQPTKVAAPAGKKKPKVKGLHNRGQKAVDIINQN